MRVLIHGTAVVPEPAGPAGFALPWVVHLLGLALAGSVALNLSRGWWQPAREALGDLDRGRRTPLGWVLGALAAAYGMEVAVRWWLVPWLVGAGAAWPAFVLPAVPYFLTYLVISRGERITVTGGGWAAVGPAFRTVVPWTAAAILVFAFPAMSRGPAEIIPKLHSLGVWALYGILPSALTFPLFLRAVPAALSMRGGPGDQPRGQFRRLAAVAAGVLLLAVWVALPRPVAGREAVVGSLVLAEVLFRLASLAPAGFVQASDRGLIWPPLASLLAVAGSQLVPMFLGALVAW